MSVDVNYVKHFPVLHQQKTICLNAWVESCTTAPQRALHPFLLLKLFSCPRPYVDLCPHVHKAGCDLKTVSASWLRIWRRQSPSNPATSENVRSNSFPPFLEYEAIWQRRWSSSCRPGAELGERLQIHCKAYSPRLGSSQIESLLVSFGCFSTANRTSSVWMVAITTLLWHTGSI